MSYVFSIRYYPSTASLVMSSRHNIAGIVFERYIEGMIHNFLNKANLQLVEMYTRTTFPKLFENAGLSTENLYVINVDGAIFLYEKSITKWFYDKRLDWLSRSPKRWWWEREAADKVLSGNFLKIVIRPFSKDRHRPDFLFVAKKRTNIHIFIGDAKYRSGKYEQSTRETTLGKSDIERLMVYFRIINRLANAKGWNIEHIYVFGNQPRVGHLSYSTESIEDEHGNSSEELVRYHLWNGKVSRVPDKFFGSALELELYPKNRPDGPSMFTIRYIPVAQLVTKGLVDPQINVVVCPRYAGTAKGETDITPPYFVLSNVFRIRKSPYAEFHFKDGTSLAGYVIYEGIVGSGTPLDENDAYKIHSEFKYAQVGTNILIGAPKPPEEKYKDAIDYMKTVGSATSLELYRRFGPIAKEFIDWAIREGYLQVKGTRLSWSS